MKGGRSKTETKRTDSKLSVKRGAPSEKAGKKPNNKSVAAVGKAGGDKWKSLSEACIPLFETFFWSSTVKFKTLRLWILRLLYAGLNSDDCAQIYIRNNILEILLAFYASPLSDYESKELILQVVKKSVKLHKMARYLVEYCGMISWLSSIISVFCRKQYLGPGNFPSTFLITVLEENKFN